MSTEKAPENAKSTRAASTSNVSTGGAGSKTSDHHHGIVDSETHMVNMSVHGRAYLLRSASKKSERERSARRWEQAAQKRSANKLIVILFFLAVPTLLLSFWLDRSGLTPNILAISLILVVAITLLAFATPHIYERLMLRRTLPPDIFFGFSLAFLIILLITYLVYLSNIGYRASTQSQGLQNSPTITFTEPISTLGADLGIQPEAGNFHMRNEKPSDKPDIQIASSSDDSVRALSDRYRTLIRRFKLLKTQVSAYSLLTVPTELQIQLEEARYEIAQIIGYSIVDDETFITQTFLLENIHPSSTS